MTLRYEWSLLKENKLFRRRYIKLYIVYPLLCSFFAVLMTASIVPRSLHLLRTVVFIILFAIFLYITYNDLKKGEDWKYIQFWLAREK